MREYESLVADLLQSRNVRNNSCYYLLFSRGGVAKGTLPRLANVEKECVAEDTDEQTGSSLRFYESQAREMPSVEGTRRIRSSSRGIGRS